MSPVQQMEALKASIVPRMQELGLSAFVIIGYLETENGLDRVCIANTAKNPAFEDGLRPAIHFAHMWGASPLPPEKPLNPDGDGAEKNPTG